MGRMTTLMRMRHLPRALIAPCARGDDPLLVRSSRVSSRHTVTASSLSLPEGIAIQDTPYPWQDENKA